MSKDFDNIIKEINKSHKELHQVDSKLSKELSDVNKDITNIKKDIAGIKVQVREVSNKIDMVLEILNNFTLMVMDDEGLQDLERDEEDYDIDQTWVPNEDQWSTDEDEDDEDNEDERY